MIFQEQTNILTIELKNVNGGFLFEAFCKKKTNSYCGFEYDLSLDTKTSKSIN